MFNVQLQSVNYVNFQMIAFCVIEIEIEHCQMWWWL